MAIIPEFYINAVISIGKRNATEISWMGTGFLYLEKLTKKEMFVQCLLLISMCLLTNLVLYYD